MGELQCLEGGICPPSLSSFSQCNFRISPACRYSSMLPTELRTLGNCPFFHFTAPSFLDISNNRCAASSRPVFPSEKVEFVSVFMLKTGPLPDVLPQLFSASVRILVFSSRRWCVCLCVGPAIWFLKRGGALRTISAGWRGAALRCCTCCQGPSSTVYARPCLDRRGSRLDPSPSVRDFLMVLLQQEE